MLTISQALDALVCFLASPALHREELAVVAHVQSQVVLAPEELSAVVASKNLQDVPGLHVSAKLLEGRHHFVA